MSSVVYFDWKVSTNKLQPQVVIHEVLAHVSDVQRRDALVFRWCQLGHRVVSERKHHLVRRRSQFKSNVILNFLSLPSKQLLGNRVVDSVESISNVLVGERVVRIGRLLVSIVTTFDIMRFHIKEF